MDAPRNTIPLDLDPLTRARIAELADEGMRIFDRFDSEVRQLEFHPFIPADYEMVLRELVALRSPGLSFLEWGSATGVITIMADLLGYDACGIEIDAGLVETARELAARFSSGARFAAGSFLPMGYEWQTAGGDTRMGTIGTAVSGYLTLGRPLADFDIVYGYPWGGEEDVMKDLMRAHGRPDALLLLHGGAGALHRYRGGRRVG
jgi:SAM-dependent methyltransferase